jgi:hypothetical protein
LVMRRPAMKSDMDNTSGYRHGSIQNRPGAGLLIYNSAWNNSNQAFPLCVCHSARTLRDRLCILKPAIQVLSSVCVGTYGLSTRVAVGWNTRFQVRHAKPGSSPCFPDSTASSDAVTDSPASNGLTRACCRWRRGVRQENGPVPLTCCGPDETSNGAVILGVGCM